MSQGLTALDKTLRKSESARAVEPKLSSSTNLQASIRSDSNEDELGHPDSDHDFLVLPTSDKLARAIAAKRQEGQRSQP
jgi:hypothetical protein